MRLRSCLGLLDRGIALACRCELDAENAPVPGSWTIQRGTGRRVWTMNDLRDIRSLLRRRDLHCDQ